MSDIIWNRLTKIPFSYVLPIKIQARFTTQYLPFYQLSTIVNVSVITHATLMKAAFPPKRKDLLST